MENKSDLQISSKNMPRIYLKQFFITYFVLQVVYEPSVEIRKLQKKMSALFERQKRKGGVIDVEQERNRFLIDITSVCLLKGYAEPVLLLRLLLPLWDIRQQQPLSILPYFMQHVVPTLCSSLRGFAKTLFCSS